MKTPDSKVIMTKHPLKKSGIIISKSLYKAIVEFISANLYFSDTIDLRLLIARSALKFPECHDISLFIYYIKLDLEARGMIEGISNGNIGTLLIRLTKRGIDRVVQRRNRYRK